MLKYGHFFGLMIPFLCVMIYLICLLLIRVFRLFAHFQCLNNIMMIIGLYLFPSLCHGFFSSICNSKENNKTMNPYISIIHLQQLLAFCSSCFICLPSTFFPEVFQDIFHMSSHFTGKYFMYISNKDLVTSDTITKN